MKLSVETPQLRVLRFAPAQGAQLLERCEAHLAAGEGGPSKDDFVEKLRESLWVAQWLRDEVKLEINESEWAEWQAELNETLSISRQSPVVLGWLSSPNEPFGHASESLATS